MDRERLEHDLDLVTDRLKNLQRPEEEAELVKRQQATGQTIGAFPRDFGMEPWDWPQGVGLYGMLKRYEYSGDEKILDYLLEWYTVHLDETMPRRNINTTCPLLTLASLADRKVGYYSLCDDWARWIMAEQPRTEENGFQHTTTKDAAQGTLNMNEGQIWIDTLFMTVLFLAKWGVKTQDRALCQEAVHQYLMMVKYLYEKKQGLFFHAWSFEERGNFGEVFWCRGNSWYTASLPDFVEIMGDQLEAGVREFLTDTWKSQVRALAKLQAKDGLWHTVLDDEDSYEETSGSAAIAYGLLKGIRMGLLGEEYRKTAEHAIEGIRRNIREDGTVMNVSAGTPVGRSREHYKNIAIAPMAYGQSLCVMALTEALRAEEH